MRHRRSLPFVLVVLLLLLALPSPRAVADDTKALRAEIQRLTDTIRELKVRIEALEARIRLLSGARPSPAEPTPEPQPGRPGPGAGVEGPVAGLLEEYDRFTGDRRVEVSPIELQATHKDVRGRHIQLQVGWVLESEGGAAPTIALTVGSLGRLRHWPSGAPIYMLVDGYRMTSYAESKPSKEEGGPCEVLRVALTLAVARQFASARKVEVRAGDWEFEIPATFREQVKKALERDELIGTDK